MYQPAAVNSKKNYSYIKTNIFKIVLYIYLEKPKTSVTAYTSAFLNNFSDTQLAFFNLFSLIFFIRIIRRNSFSNISSHLFFFKNAFTFL